MSGRLAIGIGCRKGIAADRVETVVRASLAGLAGAPAGLFTIDAKLAEAGLADAARHLGLPLVGLSPAALRAVEAGVLTPSPHALERFGVPAVAEAAALAAFAGRARLVLTRIVRDGVTLAVAEEILP